MMFPPSSGPDWYTAFAFIRWGTWANTQVMPRLAGGLGWLAQETCKAPLAQAMGLSVRAMAAADLGETARAIQLAQAMVGTAFVADAATCHWYFVNTAVDILVNAGRYRQALAVHERWSTEAQESGRVKVPLAAVFAQINQAEALHNLGRSTEALALLAGREVECEASALAMHGLWSLRAWVLAHAGQPSAARDQMAQVSRAMLGPRYHAEFHYTHAAIARELGECDRASGEVRRGLRSARRAASRRNGIHMLASIAAVRGEDEQAIKYLQSAAACRYQGQGGPYHLLLGETYERLGQSQDARQAFARVVERDPESHAATKAAERLRQLTAKMDADSR